MGGPGEASRLLLGEVVDLLESAEIPAATEPADVNVADAGGAWVTLAALRPQTLAGGWSADVAVFLIARDAGADEATQDLGDLLDAALPVLAGHLTPGEDVTTENLQLPSGPPLPALRLQLTFDI